MERLIEKKEKMGSKQLRRIFMTLIILSMISTSFVDTIQSKTSLKDITTENELNDIEVETSSPLETTNIGVMENVNYPYINREKKDESLKFAEIGAHDNIDEPSENSNIIKGNEIIQMRTPNSKTYENEDGSRIIKASSHSLHYWDGDSWQDIETTITSNSNLAGYSYSNVKNTIETYFKDHSDDPAQVRIENGNAWLTQSTEYIAYSDSRGNVDFISNIKNVPGVVSGDTIEYRDAFPGIDDRWKVQSGLLKHDVVLTRAPRKPSDSLISSKLTFNVGGTIQLRDGITVWVDGIRQTNDFMTTSKIEFRDASNDIVFVMQSAIA